MKFEYRLNLSEYKEFNHFHSKKSLSKIALIYFFAMASLSILLLFLEKSISITGILYSAILPNLLTTLAIYAIIRFLHQYIIASAWKKLPFGNNEMIVEIDDEELIICTPTSKTIFQWAAFTHWQETENLFLVYQSPTYSNIFPKRALVDNETIDALRELLSSKLPNPPHR
jgi:hypothetical protein